MSGEVGDRYRLTAMAFYKMPPHPSPPVGGDTFPKGEGFLFHFQIAMKKSRKSIDNFQKFYLPFRKECYILSKHRCRCDGMVDVVDSKSTAGDSVPVRVRSPAPRKQRSFIGSLFSYLQTHTSVITEFRTDVRKAQTAIAVCAFLRGRKEQKMKNG